MLLLRRLGRRASPRAVRPLCSRKAAHRSRGVGGAGSEIRPSPPFPPTACARSHVRSSLSKQPTRRHITQQQGEEGRRNRAFARLPRLLKRAWLTAFTSAPEASSTSLVVRVCESMSAVRPYCGQSGRYTVKNNSLQPGTKDARGGRDSTDGAQNHTMPPANGCDRWSRGRRRGVAFSASLPTHRVPCIHVGPLSQKDVRPNRPAFTGVALDDREVQRGGSGLHKHARAQKRSLSKC